MIFIFGGSTEVLAPQRTARFLVPFIRWLRPDLSDAEILKVQFIIRKMGHLTEYAVLATLLWRARRHTAHPDQEAWSWKDAAWAFSIASLYAISDEFHQSFVMSRHGSGWDVTIDMLGVALGLVYCFLLQRARLERRLRQRG